MTTPIAAAANGKPSRPMPATQSGESAHKPRGDYSVDCSPAHRCPACAAEQCGREELLGCGRAGPAEDANSQKDCTNLCRIGNTKARVECRQIGHDDCTNNEMGCHGLPASPYSLEAPASRLAGRKSRFPRPTLLIRRQRRRHASRRRNRYAARRSSQSPSLASWKPARPQRKTLR
jgi:hypothetical protein